MATTNFPNYLAVLSLMTGVLALAGCGASEPQSDTPIERGVFTSATDCAEGGKRTLEQCSAAITAAVAEHERAAATYPSLKSCETAEGADKCERTDTKSFRPRLMAFLVRMTDPPAAWPLYPTIKGEAGFRTGDNTILLSEDESLTFSRPALAAAELHAGKGSASSSYNF